MRLLRSSTRNAVFYGDRLALHLGEGERLDAALHDPDSTDLLTWNVFASLDTHRDQDWVAYRLQALGGAAVRPPVRIALWTGREREPLLHPSQGYLRFVRERSRSAGGSDDQLAPFAEPIEVPVRIESPDILVLVDTVGEEYPRGNGGRDRLLELIDAGLEHARRLSSSLTVAVVYPSGTPAARALSSRIDELRDPATRSAEMPYRAAAEPVVLRELSWQRLIQLWEAERDYLDLSGQPVKGFLAQLSARGLRGG